jgi:hypothetical protein
MPTPESAIAAHNKQVLVNQTPVEVEYTTGRKENLTMRRLSIRELYTLAEHVRGSRTPAIVALCFDKPIEWVDELSDACFAELSGKCVSANFQRAQAIAEKDPVMAMLIGPVVATGILSMAEMLRPTAKAIAGAVTSDSSPVPAHSESAAETGSAAST